MKIVTVHRGARDNYQVARALGEAGLLEQLVTDLYWPGDRGWARGVERLAPGKTSKALRCRYAEGLSSDSVSSCWLSGLGSLAAGKTQLLPFDLARQATRWCDRSLGERAGRIASEKGAALLAYSYYAHSAFSSFTGDQPRILFQLHPHPASVRTILQQERRLNPDCASSLDKEWELALPEADFQRLVQEAAMAQHWIVASEFTKKTLIDNGIPEQKVAVIPYGINTDVFVPKKKLRDSRRPLQLLFVGRIAQRKGIKYLIEALGLLPPGSVELTVCGHPVDDLALFRDCPLPIRLHPSISAQGLLDAYQEADVFVLPSLAEGFAQVLLEAMASGLPIISTTRTAAPDLIRHGREGFIVSPGNAAELAGQIERFLQQPQLIGAMGQAARQRAEYFTWHRFRRGVIDFANGVLQGSFDFSESKPCLSL